MVVSLFSFKESIYSGLNYVTATLDTTYTKTEYQVLYVYPARTLVLIYALAVAGAHVMAVAGSFALRQNGMASNQTVSAIIRMTRNPALDRYIVVESRLGGEVIGDAGAPWGDWGGG